MKFNFSTGMRIIGCINLANIALGSIMFVEIGLALFNLAINTYFICTIYVLFVADPFPWVVLWFILVNVVMFILATCRIINMTSGSECLSKELKLAKDCVQNYQVLTSFAILYFKRSH